MCDIPKIADRVEFNILAQAAPSTEDGLREQLAASGLPSDQDTIDETITNLFDEIVDRKNSLQDKYPFEIARSMIRASDPQEANLPYVSCLAFEFIDSELITDECRKEGFESLALTAASRYFKTDINIRLCQPWDHPEFESFEDALRTIGRLMAELPEPVNLAPRGGGDEGWDCLLLKPFIDLKYPRLLIVGNCATGKTNWLNKGAEASAQHLFEYYFASQPRGPLLKFFAVPFRVTDNERSRKVDADTFLFDRSRLAKYSKGVPKILEDWCATAIAQSESVSLA